MTPECVEIGDAILFQKVQDEVVLLNMDSEQYYGLNPVAAEMWASLMKCGRVSEAAESLIACYEVEPETLKSDLNKLVTELMSGGLLKATV